MTNQEFAELMQQYQRLIYTVCLQFVHDPPTAEDLTQDTFLSAFTSIDRCDPAYRKQWLVRVAANKCKDHLKSAWVRRVEAQDHQSLPEPRGAPPAGLFSQPSPAVLASHPPFRCGHNPHSVRKLGAVYRFVSYKFSHSTTLIQLNQGIYEFLAAKNGRG